MTAPLRLATGTDSTMSKAKFPTDAVSPSERLNPDAWAMRNRMILVDLVKRKPVPKDHWMVDEIAKEIK